MFPVADVIPSRSRPYVTIGLIALNAVAFAAELLAGDLLPRVLFALGLVPVFYSWTDVLSSMFLHSGWVHFLGNMLYLWIFGDTVEDRLGHVAANPYSSTPVIGASGAVSGVLGAYFVLYPQSRILTAVFLVVVRDLVEVPAVAFLGIWLLLQAFSGAGAITAPADGSAASWSHVVGFAVGAMGGWFWRRRIAYP